VEAVVRLTAIVLALSALACQAEPPCGLGVCDIRDPACQQRTAAAAACLRGSPEISIPMKVVRRDDFVNMAVADAQRGGDEAWLRTWARAMSLLTLAPATLEVSQAASAQAGWVGAFYDPQDRSITIIDWGYPLDTMEAVGTLVHEYAHALQDARKPIPSLYEHAGDFDSQLAVSAAIEGEAVVVEDLATLGLFGTDEGQVDWPKVFGGWQSWVRQQAYASRLPVLLADGDFPYPFGSELVHRVRAAGGWEAVGSLLGNPPLSSRQVLAGEIDGSRLGPAAGLGQEAIPLLTIDFQLLNVDRYGAWVAEIFFQHMHLPDPPGLARQLETDVLAIHRQKGTEGVVVSWRLRFASGDAAAAVVAAISRAAVSSSAVRWAFTRDRDAIIVAADGTVQLTSPERLAWGPIPPPPPTDPPKPAPTLIACPRRAPAAWPR
jgi:hypothetical protein